MMGFRRWLIQGQLREKRPTLPRPAYRVHDRQHSRIMARIVYLIEKWLETQIEPRGQILCGWGRLPFAPQPEYDGGD